MTVLNNPRKYYWVTLFQSANILAPVLTLFYLSRGITFSQLFTLYAIVVISMFCFEVPTGILGDKYGRKTSIIIGLFGWILFGIGLLFAQSFLAFALLFILWGFNATCSSGSDEAMIYDSLKLHEKEDEMQSWMGKINSARFLPGIILAPIGAFIAKDLVAWQFDSLLIANIFFTCIALVIAFFLTETKIAKSTNEVHSPLSHLRESFSHIRKTPNLLKLFLNKTLILIPASHIFGLLWQPYLQSATVPVAWFGVLTTISAIMVYFASKNIDSIEKKISGTKIIFYTALLSLVAFLAGAFTTNIWLAITLYFVISVSVWVRDPVFSQYMNKHINSHNRATVLSALSMVDSSFDIIIFLLAGFLSSMNLAYTFMFSAGLILIALIFFKISKTDIETSSK